MSAFKYGFERLFLENSRKWESTLSICLIPYSKLSKDHKCLWPHEVWT